MKAKVFHIILGLAVIACLLYIGVLIKAPKPVKTYSNSKYQLSFDYPSKYLLLEKDITSPSRYHEILLVLNNETNRGLLDGSIVGEGPTAITIDIYNNGANAQVLDWIKNSPNSNFQLSKGTITETKVAGVNGSMYNWDGLYTGETTVFAHNKYIYTTTVTYLSPKDKIIADFRFLLNSLKFL